MVRVNSVNIDQHITKGYPTRFSTSQQLSSPHLVSLRSVAQKPIASDFSYDLYINPSPIPQPGGAGDAIRLVFHPKVAQHCCHEPTTRTKDATGLAFGNTKVRKPLHSHRC